MKIILKDSYSRQIKIDNSTYMSAHRQPAKKVEKDLYQVGEHTYRTERYHIGNTYLSVQDGWIVHLLNDAVIHTTHPAFADGIHSSVFFADIPDPFEKEVSLEKQIAELDMRLLG